METRLKLMQQFLEGKVDSRALLPVTFPPTLNRTLGIDLISVADGEAVMQMHTDPTKHANPMGTIHGGVLCDLGDAAMGVAHSMTLQAGESFTSVDLRINFLRPVWKDTLVATAMAIHRGRTISYYECTVVNAAGKAVAKLTSSIMTLRGEQASGR